MGLTLGVSEGPTEGNPVGDWVDKEGAPVGLAVVGLRVAMPGEGRGDVLG